MVNTPEDKNNYDDLEEILRHVRRYNMHVNLIKCSFEGPIIEILGIYANQESD